MAEVWRNIVLTGASSGLGRALALALARPGRRLLLVARGAEGLAAVAAELRARGAVAETAAVAVTDAAALAAALRAFDAGGAVDLVIANAGATGGREGPSAPEPPGQSARLVAVNLVGAMNTVEPLLPAMIARGRGHVLLVSSIAALRPQGDEPAYSAAKAGLRAWGIGMRGWLRPLGVRVTVACPGFVATPMSARHLGPKPFELSAAAAARRILAGTARGAAVITFPWPLLLLIRLGNLLPPRLSDWFERRLAARILPDPRAGAE